MTVKRTASLFLVILCFSCQQIILAQASKRTKAKPATVDQRKPITISGGVMNAKALSLAVPHFPHSAHLTNTYGSVVVQILIDTDGNVNTAIVLSGHPLLRVASINAALISKFAPVTIGGTPVLISGIINYHYIPKSWNWLEIGFTLEARHSGYYSIYKLGKFFPGGFQDEVLLLDQSNKRDVVAIVIASVQNKVLNDRKHFWLFEVGLALGKLKQGTYRGAGQEMESGYHIRALIYSAPENTSAILINRLNQLDELLSKEYLDSNQVFNGPALLTFLNELQQDFPQLGK